MNIIHYSTNADFSKALSKSSANTVIALDSRLISSHHIRLPKMSHGKSIKALPFALESQLLDDIDTLTFFPQKSPTSADWEVLVIASEVLNTLKEKLQTAQCNAISIVPDFLLLPFIPKQITFFEHDDSTIYRNGVLQGGRIDTDLFAQIFNNSAQLTQSKLSYDVNNKINFLSNNLHANVQKYFKPWRFAAVVATLMLLLSTAQNILFTQQLDSQLSQKKSDNQRQFKSLFPTVKQIIDIRAQTEQKISKLSGQKILYKNDFLTQLAKIRPSIQADEVIFKNQKLTITDLK